MLFRVSPEHGPAESSDDEVDLPLLLLQFDQGVEDEAKLLALDYWDHAVDEYGRAVWKNTVAAVSEEYAKPQWNLAAALASYCYALVKESRCQTCQHPLVASSRSNIVPRRLNCEHCEADLRMQTEGKRKAEAEAQQRLSHEKLSYLNSCYSVVDEVGQYDLDLAEWDLADVLGLDLILASCASNGTFVVPASTERPFVFDESWLVDRLKFLREEGLLLVHPSSPVEAFAWDVSESGDVSAPRYFPSLCIWYLAGRGPLAARVAEVRGALGSQIRNDRWPAPWVNEGVDLVDLVVRREAQRYYEWAVDTHDLPPLETDRNLGELAKVIQLAATRYSLGQICSIIWSIAKDGAAVTQRHPYMSRQSATTHTLHRIEQYVTKAIAQEWSLRVFREQADCPLSVITLRLFELLELSPVSATLGDARRALSERVDFASRVELKIMQGIDPNDYPRARASLERVAEVLTNSTLSSSDVSSELWLTVEALVSLKELLDSATAMGCSHSDAFRAVYVGIETLSLLNFHRSISEVRKVMRNTLSGSFDASELLDDLVTWNLSAATVDSPEREGDDDKNSSGG